jgi:quercetin dioxygenase-like cupin family protein
MFELRMAGAAAFLALALAAVPASAQSGAAEPSQYQTLLTTVLSGNQTIIGQTIAYPPGTPDITAAVVTIPPGGETGWHIHDVPLFAYIIDGEITVDYGSEGTRLYTAGDGLLEAFQWPHNGVNTGTMPVRILAVYMGADGLANTTMVEGPHGSARLVPANHHVVAVNHFRPARVAEYRLDFRTVAATDPFGIGGVEGDQTTPDLLTLGADDANGITALEPAVDARHAGRQQTLARSERRGRTGIDHHRAAGLEMTRNPFLARGARFRLGEEPGAALAVGNGGERVHTVTVGDDHGGAGGNRDPARLDFGLHTAARQLGPGGPGHGLDLRRHAFHQFDEPRVRVGDGRSGKEPVHV